MGVVTKAQLAERERIAARLEAAESELASALEEAKSFADEISSAIDEYAGDRSDRWRESEASYRYFEWAVAWQDFDTDAEFEWAQLFRDLPAAPGEA